MAFVKISSIAGTKDTMTLPIIIVGKKTVELTPKVIALLGLGDKGRVVCIVDNEDDSVYLGKSADEKSGHAVSSGGKFQNDMVKSWLDALSNDDKQIIVTNNNVEFEGVTYYRLETYVAPEVVEAPVGVAEVAVEARAEVVAIEEEVHGGDAEGVEESTEVEEPLVDEIPEV